MKKITKDKIKKLLLENLPEGRYNISFNDDISQFGMDSIQFINFVVSLEELFDCEIPDSKLVLEEMNTIDKVYAVLSSICDK